MQFIVTIFLTAAFGLSMLQCQSTTTTNKSETAKNNTNVSTTSSAPKTADTHSDEHSDDAPRISVEEAKKAYDAGDVIVIDTRAESAYKTEHIKGAINIPAEAFQTRYKEVPKGKKIIAYCS
jgi:3-mercaptopyruvate sulfurtransferase SseA